MTPEAVFLTSPGKGCDFASANKSSMMLGPVASALWIRENGAPVLNLLNK
jgi:hypothetical protein